jgi:thiamine biosynthesis lipoprotein
MNEYRISVKLMGSAFGLVVVHENEKAARELLDAGIREIERIENLLSEFRPGSVTSQINENAGIHAVPVDGEVYALTERCLQVSAITQGAFDISTKPLKSLYHFKNGNFHLPSNEIIRETRMNTGFKKIILDPVNHSVFLSQKNMAVSFASIGKGYAADRVKKKWIGAGVTSGVINASGDLTTIGQRADGTPWKVGIAHPDKKNEIMFYLPVHNASVATSGDYEQFFMHRGTRYSHIINPKSGLPVKGIKSVSVIAPSAELSDALATAVYVMGVGSGLYFINQLPNTHCLIIDEKNKSFFSKNLVLSYAK